MAARGKPVSHCCQRRRHLHPAVPPHSRDTWRVAWRQQRASCTRWLCRRGWRRGEALWRWVCVFVEREAHVGMDTGRSRSAIEDYLPGAQILVLRNTQTEASPHVVRCVLRQGGAGLRLARGPPAGPSGPRGCAWGLRAAWTCRCRLASLPCFSVVPSPVRTGLERLMAPPRSGSRMVPYHASCGGVCNGVGAWAARRALAVRVAWPPVAVDDECGEGVCACGHSSTGTDGLPPCASVTHMLPAALNCL